MNVGERVIEGNRPNKQPEVRKPLSLLDPLVSETAMRHTRELEASIIDPDQWIAEHVWAADQRIAEKQDAMH